MEPDVPDIEYYYSVSSVFAYFGSHRLTELAQRHGARVIHKPIFHGVVVPETGGLRFRTMSPVRIAHFFREVERWSAYLNIPVVSGDPKNHYTARELPSGMVIAAQRHGLDVDTLSFKICEALWRDERDMADASVLAEIATSLGMDAELLLNDALLPDVQAEYEKNSKDCVAKGGFGSPTYVVNDEPFWGQDRLEFVERALVADAT
jgi:2-hydroxychromene-2-carboxylate isomerase